MIASDLANQIDAFESILTNKDVEEGKLLVRRADLGEMLQLSKRMLDGHERPFGMSLHDIERSCAASRITKEIG